MVGELYTECDIATAGRELRIVDRTSGQRLLDADVVRVAILDDETFILIELVQLVTKGANQVEIVIGEFQTNAITHRSTVGSKASFQGGEVGIVVIGEETSVSRQ